jgi:hypothetical protein
MTMATHRDDDPTKYPWLGRKLLWVDQPGNPWKLVLVLMAACAVAAMLEFTYEKHGHNEFENGFGFFAVYGFVMFTALIFLARGLRVLVKRPEDYYSPKSIDTEDYPESGLERIEHDV